MKAAEIRSKFLNYFKKNGHTIVESSPLVPQNDPTLLFTNAGMVQFKDVFLGNDPRPYTRATTSQKCVRAGGKHNDLENVGFTARHHTFFEMLGNFSFGDYFKKEAIHFAWEFVTQELKLPKDRLYVTVYEKDDEAAEIWHNQENVPMDRIYRFGEKDNFWSMGDTGPCGPCTEIFIDRGEKYGCKKPTCKMGCDCDRYMEFWNLVFMQFNRDAKGVLTPLPKPSVDTGAGLERIASILQDVDTNYDTDIFQHIISETGKLAGVTYNRHGDNAASFRVIADHSRATAFLIADGVMPSNEGRGYVLRRIIRRAIRHGKKLGFTGPFLNKTAGFVIDQMKDAYPDLVDKRALIEKAVTAEEEQFFRTLDKGISLFNEWKQENPSQKTLPGEVAFKLYDTFGFPLDLTRVMANELGIEVDEAGFEKCMDRQREMARKNWKGSGEEAVSAIYQQLAAELRDAGKLPQFVGYEKVSAEGACLAILSAGGESLELKRTQQISATGGETLVQAIFAVTPFYGESGGQSGDKGDVTGNGFEGEVIDCTRPVPELIVAQIKPLKGTLKVGATYNQRIHEELRALTARNHTATHLLHWALREVLGKHVKQAGSLVTPELLRFDFSHFQAMTPEEIQKVETLINQKIWADQEVSKKEMGKEEAIAAGAIAFFGEKYGDKVRVVRVGDFSTELCGGTHINRSSDIHLFKIASETGIAAGVRRIIAYTSQGAFQYFTDREDHLKKVRDQLKVNTIDEIHNRLEKLMQTERELRKQIEQFQAQAAAGEVDEMIAKAKTIGSVQLVAALATPHADGIKRLRDLADRIKQKNPACLVVLGMKDTSDPEKEKAAILVAVGPQAPKALSAAELLKELSPLIDGRGGGKPDMAQAGGTKVSGLSESLTKAESWLAAKSV